MPSKEDDISDGEQSLDLFKEPDDFYVAEKPATFTQYKCKNGSVVKLRLVGHSPLWGHLLWNAGQIVANYLEENATSLVLGKSVLELGAGAGLPSLVCASLGASKVVVTDYPDANLIENLEFNIAQSFEALKAPRENKIVAEGYLWGDPIDRLISHLPSCNTGFDLLILADILFNHSEHAKLVKTVKQALGSSTDAIALVFFTPYRPWLLEKDLYFFELAKNSGLQITKILEHVMDKVMFEADPGDELLRRTVFGYEVKNQAERDM